MYNHEMDEIFPLLGYLYTDGIHGESEILENIENLLSFLHANLYAEQVMITDGGDNLWFEAFNGVDLYSRLDELGIDLPGLFHQVRQELYFQDEEQEIARQPWEALYDSIGLSPGEIAMRSRVKERVKKAETVEDVIQLLDGTYFDAVFTLPSESENYGRFNPEDCSISFTQLDGQESYEEQREKVVFLDRTTRVRHIASGEDIHHFEVIDLPDPSIQNISR
jgi:hypothetical protein